MTQHGAMELEPGQQFRGLLIHSLLNRGAMGAAYLASHPVLQTPLIVKTFASTGGDPFREAHLAARVHSPHVVGVVDAGYEGGGPFVVQRYVDGIDLGELLSRMRAMKRVLPTRVVVRLVAEIATGLYALHQAGVVHRDIKPDNLFLSGEGHALVGDLGIAVDRAAAEDAKRMLAGTPAFIAPEVWRGDPVDGRADIYSLGATAHLLATGAPPFTGGTLPELMHAHVEQSYAPPVTDRPAAAYLFTAIASMLAKQPARRPRSADHVANLLKPIAHDHPRLMVTTPLSAYIAGIRIDLYCDDIATTAADVIVNAANSQLTMNVGVARALREAGGEKLQAQAEQAGFTPMGGVVWTNPGQLSCKWVAHAVAALSGAVCLQRCTLRVLLEAQSRGARTVAFPALGTGVGQVPHALAAKLMLEAMITYARLGTSSIERISVVLYDNAALDQWSTVLQAMKASRPGD